MALDPKDFDFPVSLVVIEIIVVFPMPLLFSLEVDVDGYAFGGLFPRFPLKDLLGEDEGDECGLLSCIFIIGTNNSGCSTSSSSYEASCHSETVMERFINCSITLVSR